MASAYACIVQVLHDMKKDVATVTEERHRAATQLKATLECITPVADQRMSTKATMLARQFYMKVSMLVCERAMFGPDNVYSVCSLPSLHVVAKATCIRELCNCILIEIQCMYTHQGKLAQTVFSLLCECTKTLSEWGVINMLYVLIFCRKWKHVHS